MFKTLTRCSKCKKMNRVPASHLAEIGVCGACRAALGPASEPIEADSGSFDGIVQDARVPVIVDFWASWCGPCRMAAPELEGLAKEMAGRALVVKVNTEEYPELASRFQIQSIPNFLIFNNGQLAQRRAGFAPRHDMRKWLEQAGA